MSRMDSLVKKTHCLRMPLVKPEASGWLCLLHSKGPAHISRADALGYVTVYDTPFGCGSAEGFWRKGRTSAHSRLRVVCCVIFTLQTY